MERSYSEKRRAMTDLEDYFDTFEAGTFIINGKRYGLEWCKEHLQEIEDMLKEKGGKNGN